MIIHLDWFGCTPRSKWETGIHEILEALTAIKSITRASVRIEDNPDSNPRFHLTAMLSMPGPDVLATGTGHTFEEALIKLAARARKSLTIRLRKAGRYDAAPRGVKTAHRG